MESALPILLYVHFIGMGLFFTTSLGGMIVEFRLAKAPNPEGRLQLAGVGRILGLLSPLAALIMLITGIGNMHAIGAGILDLGWLTAKLFFFAIALISGILHGIKSRKRGALLAAMVKGTSAPDAEAGYVMLTRQIRLFYIVLPTLLLIIVALSVYGVHGY